MAFSAVGIIVFWIYVFSRLGYPPSLEQINLGNILLWRIVSFALMGAVGLRLWRYNEKLAVIVLLLSPAMWGMTMLHPIEAVIWAGIVLVGTLRFRFRYAMLALVLGITTMFWWKGGDMVGVLDMKGVTGIVNQRFMDEEGMTEIIKFPNWFRRAATNKVTIMGVDVWEKVVAAADLETLFFGEIHPLSRKTLPIFFWPMIVLLPFGIVVCLKDRRKNEILIWLGVGCVYFLLNSSEYYVRFSIIALGLALVLARGWQWLQSHYRWMALIVGIFVVYGVTTFEYDIGTRPEYWLDNRPLMYMELWKRIGKVEGGVVATDLVGNSLKYCRVYLGDKCDLYEYGIDSKKFASGITYAGFIGEFIGKDFNNKFSENVAGDLNNQGWVLLDSFEVKDTIANQYGQTIVIVKKR